MAPCSEFCIVAAIRLFFIAPYFFSADWCSRSTPRSWRSQRSCAARTRFGTAPRAMRYYVHLRGTLAKGRRGDSVPPRCLRPRVWPVSGLTVTDWIRNRTLQSRLSSQIKDRKFHLVLPMVSMQCNSDNSLPHWYIYVWELTDCWDMNSSSPEEIFLRISPNIVWTMTLELSPVKRGPGITHVLLCWSIYHDCICIGCLEINFEILFSE